MRGFVSVLFLLLVSEALVLVGTLEHAAPMNGDSTGVVEVLGLKRLELENAADELIREELFVGLVLKLPRETIQENINAHLIQYLTQWAGEQDSSIAYEMGFAALEQTNYLSLLRGELKPLNMDTLARNTHVLVLPIDAENSYGEYAYTGGANGTNILVMRMRTQGRETLFALPNGHRTCASTLIPILPCAVGHEEWGEDEHADA